MRRRRSSFWEVTCGPPWWWIQGQWTKEINGRMFDSHATCRTKRQALRRCRQAVSAGVPAKDICVLHWVWRKGRRMLRTYSYNEEGDR